MEISPLLYPTVFVLLAWWFSTGAILYLDQLPAKTYTISMSGATALAIGALMMLAVSSHSATAANAYIGFSAALIIWGWQEMAFLMGFITGSRKSPCPPDATEMQKFLYATETILYHELALVISVLVLFAATWAQPNQIGAYTFFILWVMRLSAKLNLFFGVRNRYESFLPAHMIYLKTYFGQRSINLLFPVVVTASSVIAFVLWQDALAPGASGFEHAGYSLLATLLTLAVLEHWFLIIPLPVEKMWKWAMRAGGATNASH
jgi:putative photosynthetic complex assembly protein 2